MVMVMVAMVTVTVMMTVTVTVMTVTMAAARHHGHRGLLLHAFYFFEERILCILDITLQALDVVGELLPLRCHDLTRATVRVRVRVRVRVCLQCTHLVFGPLIPRFLSQSHHLPLLLAPAARWARPVWYEWHIAAWCEAVWGAWHCLNACCCLCVGFGGDP